MSQRREIPTTVTIEDLIFTQGIGHPRILLITAICNLEEHVLVLLTIRQIANANGVLKNVEILTRELSRKILGLHKTLIIRANQSTQPLQNRSLIDEAHEADLRAKGIQVFLVTTAIRRHGAESPVPIIRLNLVVVLHVGIRLLHPLIVSHEALTLLLLAERLIPLHRIETEETHMGIVASGHRLDLVLKICQDLILAREENVLKDLVENIGVGEEFGGLKSLLLRLPLIKELEILITGLREDGILKGGVKNRLLLGRESKIAGRGHGCCFARSVGGV